VLLEPATFFLALAVGLVFGGLAVWLMQRGDASNAYARGKSESAAEITALTERVTGKQVRIDDLTNERDQLKGTVELLRNESGEAKARQAALETKLSESQAAAQEKLALLNEAQQKLSDAFKALSAEALRSNNQAFLDLAQGTLEKFQQGAEYDLEGRQKAIVELVNPLKDCLTRVGANIQELEVARAAAYAGISEQVRALIASQEGLRTETSNLVNALRTPAVRGRWGEVQLRRVVELAGMVPYCDFSEQASVETEDGRVRPDMIVRLPNDRSVVVDAKVSLKAYLEALDSHDEAAKRVKLAEHAVQVRAHLQKLGSKAYWGQFQSTPEFVVAFIPGEVFFSAALQQDPGLIEYSVEQGVIPATPTTVIALLKAVAYGWRQEKLTQNALEISELGKELYSRLHKFSGHLEEVRKHLHRTVTGYNRAVASLESRVLVSARKFHSLGAAPEGEIAAPPPIDSVPRSLEAAEEPCEDPQLV
jgi:DNA recombination protein RmuC